LEATRAEVESGRDNPEYEIRLLMPDGRVKHVRAFAEVVQGAQGQMICIGAVQDVSRRRLAEDTLDKVRSDLAHLSRITTLGSLTASIAHEVNQPLAGITTNANTCARMLSADTPNVVGAIETVRRMIRDATRAAEVVSRLRALFSGRTTKTREVDINEAAAEVLTLMSSDLQRDRVQVQTNFAAELPTVTADRVQLQQVIMNLLKNAADAMSGVEDRQRLAILETKREGVEAVRVSVRDSGVGFVVDAAERMFQVFYSTKNNGMGVGLSVSRSIIESHGGKIWAERPDGGGATFVFSIPIAPSTEEAAAMTTS
ncbi:MAG TPA: ATP-binding protein, partial [Polyangiaceae bacterium]